MRYCKKCTMPDTRPGITFDENGVCCACNHFENRKKQTGMLDGRNLSKYVISIEDAMVQEIMIVQLRYLEEKIATFRYMS